MPALKKAIADLEPLRLPFQALGVDFWVEVQRDALSTENVIRLQEPDTPERDRVQILAEAIVDWNVLERDPEPGEDEADVPRVPHTFEWLLTGEGSAAIIVGILRAMADYGSGEASPPSAAG